MHKIKNSMKILAILVTLGVPIASIVFIADAAQVSELVSYADLSSDGLGTSEWSTTESYSGGYAIHLTAPGKASWDGDENKGVGVNEGRLSIRLAPGTKLSDIESLSWRVRTEAGYPPHVDLLLDMDGDGDCDSKKDLVTGEVIAGNDDDALVAEFAYQEYVGSGYEYVGPGDPYSHYDKDLQDTFYDPIYDAWVRTFQGDPSETESLRLDNDTVCWLYSGLPGPYPKGFFGTLEAFRLGTVEVIGDTTPASVDDDTIVLEMQIEVDNWLGPADAYIDVIVLNGEVILSEPLPEVTVVHPESKTYSPGDVPVEIEAEDIFGIEKIWFNAKKGNGKWLFKNNRTYTGPTVMEDVPVGAYTFYAWARNTLDFVGVNSERTFKVRVSAVSVDVHPETLNMKSRGRWVTVVVYLPEGYSAVEGDLETFRLEVDGEAIDAVWGRVDDGKVMVKFLRSELQGLICGGDEVEVKVIGEIDGVPFEGSDTVRVIHPGEEGKGPNGFGPGKQKRDGYTYKWNWGGGKGNKAKGGKGKPGKGGKGGKW